MNKECKCSLRGQLVGDGCGVCNPEYVSASGSNDLLCCPRCGGDGGYILKKVMYYEHLFDWEGVAVSSERTQSTSGKRKHCADCYKDITAFVDKMVCEGRIEI